MAGVVVVVCFVALCSLSALFPPRDLGDRGRRGWGPGRLTRLGAVGLVVGFAGAALLAGPTGAGQIDVAGAIVLLLAAASWAAGSLYSRRAPPPRRPLVSSSMQML